MKLDFKKIKWIQVAFIGAGLFSGYKIGKKISSDKLSLLFYTAIFGGVGYITYKVIMPEGKSVTAATRPLTAAAKTTETTAAVDKVPTRDEISAAVESLVGCITDMGQQAREGIREWVLEAYDNATDHERKAIFWAINKQCEIIKGSSGDMEKIMGDLANMAHEGAEKFGDETFKKVTELLSQ